MLPPSCGSLLSRRATITSACLHVHTPTYMLIYIYIYIYMRVVLNPRLSTVD